MGSTAGCTLLSFSDSAMDCSTACRTSLLLMTDRPPRPVLPDSWSRLTILLRQSCCDLSYMSPLQPAQTMVNVAAVVYAHTFRRFPMIGSGNVDRSPWPK